MAMDEAMMQLSGKWFHALGISQAQFAANPYPVYRHWQQTSPIKELAPGQWMILNYDDVRNILMDGRFIKRTPVPRTPPPKFHTLPVLSPSMLVTNPPDHTRLRSLVNRAFQPKHLERLRPYIAELAGELLDSFVNNGGGNLVEDYAFPLPALVIAELLGVPAKDRNLFRSLSQKIALMIDPTQEPAIRQQGQEARWELLDYFHHLAQQKKQNPGDDLLSALLQVQGQEGTLSAGELLTMSLLLLVAGHETTTNLISLGTYRLLMTPSALDELRLHPELWASAVEECLRFESPVQLDGRMAQQDVRMGDQIIPEGASVTLVLAQANRDPRVFPNPDTFDIHRHPNMHLAFGRGIHMCLGASLARMEATIAFSQLFRYSLELHGEPVFNPNVLLRGLKSLPLLVKGAQ